MTLETPPPPTVAVLLTVHNRRSSTLACLRRLAEQEPGPAALTVFLVDDGSSDGTGDAVRTAFPDVHILDGDGTLFWSGGMVVAEDSAARVDPDFYLWLNDDVALEPNAINTLLRTSRDLMTRGHDHAIIVGAMLEPFDGTTAYSGVVRNAGLRRALFTRVEPGCEPIRCDTMNGNLVLVPRSVRNRIGGFDRRYTHALNDLDFGLRATKHGCEVWLAPGHLGECTRGDRSEWWADGDPSVRVQLQRFCSPKGIPPRDWLRFNRRHAGWIWPVTSVTPYARVVIRALLRRAFGRRPGVSPPTSPKTVPAVSVTERTRSVVAAAQHGSVGFHQKGERP